MISSDPYNFLRLQLDRLEANGGSPQDAAECARRYLELDRQRQMPVSLVHGSRIAASAARFQSHLPRPASGLRLV